MLGRKVRKGVLIEPEAGGDKPSNSLENRALSPVSGQLLTRNGGI